MLREEDIRVPSKEDLEIIKMKHNVHDTREELVVKMKKNKKIDKIMCRFG